MKLKILIIKQGQKTIRKKEKKKKLLLIVSIIFFEAREMVLNGFKSKIFTNKSKGSGILNTNLKFS